MRVLTNLHEIPTAADFGERGRAGVDGDRSVAHLQRSTRMCGMTGDLTPDPPPAVMRCV